MVGAHRLRVLLDQLTDSAAIKKVTEQESHTTSEGKDSFLLWIISKILVFIAMTVLCLLCYGSNILSTSDKFISGMPHFNFKVEYLLTSGVVLHIFT